MMKRKKMKQEMDNEPQALSKGEEDLTGPETGLEQENMGQSFSGLTKGEMNPSSRFKNQAEAEQAYLDMAGKMSMTTKQAATLAKENQIYKDVMRELIGRKLPMSLEDPRESDPLLGMLDEVLRSREAALDEREFQHEAGVALSELYQRYPELQKYSRLLEMELLYQMDDPTTSLMDKFEEAGRRVMELVGAIKGEGSRQALEKREILNKAGVVSGDGMERPDQEAEFTGQSPDEYVAMRRAIRSKTARGRR